MFDEINKTNRDDQIENTTPSEAQEGQAIPMPAQAGETEQPVNPADATEEIPQVAFSGPQPNQEEPARQDATEYPQYVQQAAENQGDLNSNPYSPQEDSLPRPQVYPLYSGEYMQQPGGEQPKKEKKKWFSKKNGLYIAIGALSLMLVCAIVLNMFMLTTVLGKKNNGAGLFTSSREPGQGISVTESPKTDTTLPGNGVLLTPAQVAAKVRPSVVSVITYDPTTLGQSSGQGSGIIYSADGYIITNAHVINNSKSVHVTVILDDNSEYPATILGFDTRTDLAVLKVDATGLIPAEFGESDKLVPGDEVIAIGNPGGEQFAGSVTNGIISGIDRIINADSNSTTAMKYIQTNAAINPGNSGGALVNMYGQVIGINTAKISATGYEGLGFAIPIATAKPVIDDLATSGYVSGRVKIGITCREISSSMAQYYNVPTGLMLYSIDQESDLFGKAQAGDIISQVDGKDIASLTDMQDRFDGKNVGDTVSLTIYRPGDSRFTQSETFTVTVKLVEDKGDSASTNITEY